MSLDSIEAALTAIAAGEMVIVVAGSEQGQASEQGRGGGAGPHGTFWLSSSPRR